MESKPQNNISISGAIIIAGAIIAIAIMWNRKPATPILIENTSNNTAKVVMAPVTSADHIFGNPNAQIKIVEYSDTSCPFCKMFHPTMINLLDTYGASGDVAWVYRHFPLDKPGSRGDGGILHPNAGYEAQAMECAASLGGNDTFWKFTNRLYEITPSVTPQTPNGLDRKQLPEIAKYVGLDVVSFNDCIASGGSKDKIESQYQDGITAGVSGTPMNILVLSRPAPETLDAVILNLAAELGTPIKLSDDRLKILMAGALPETTFSRIIDTIIEN